jgi:serine phosphatase RsbU (regulator of sigma subunit)
MDVGTRMLVCLLVLASIGATRLRRIRALPAEMRLSLLAGIGVLNLLILVVCNGPLARAFADGVAPAALHGSLAAVSAMLAALALGLCWSAILDDSSRRAARLAVIGFGALAVLLCLISSPFWALLTLPLALRTGWARPIPRRPITVALGLLALATFIAWPRPPVAAFCWPPGCHYGLPLVRFARVFLAVQMALVAVKLIFGLMFGPRRIGRRLLVSHLVAGVVPVALTGVFVVLMALLAIANVRASLGTDLLRGRHAASQAILPRCVERALTTMPPSGAPGLPAALDREGLERLAVEVGNRWPAAASWRPAPETLGELPDSIGAPAARLFLFLGLEEANQGASRALLLEFDPRADRVARWIYREAAAGETVREERTTGALDEAIFAQLPPVAAWLARPSQAEGCGLVKALGNTFHAAEHRLARQGTTLRTQVIEQLPYGCSRALQELMHTRTRIAENLRFIPQHAGAEQAGGGPAPGAAASFYMPSVDSLSSIDSPLPAPSSHSSSYALSPMAQEWDPAAGEWREIRMAILGMAQLSDLIPPLPRISEDLLGLLPFIILISTALLFVLVQAVSLVMVARTGRAIARSVSLLRIGTEHVRRGDFIHRIPVEGTDELASLGEAFNEMAADLEVGRRILLEKQRLEGELELARQIQQQLLPAGEPSVPGFQLAGRSTPARQVGGDYYDFIPLGDERTLFVMADVSGKGAPAAILMSGVRAALHSIPIEKVALSDIAARLNTFIHSCTRASEFITLFVGVLDNATGELRYVNAGHDFPYLLPQAGGIERLEVGGLLMGAYPNAAYEEAVVHLRPGDRLFLYTDGLSEALDPEGVMFGEERIHETLCATRELSAAEALEMMMARVGDFTREAEASDDITMLAIRRT